MRWSRREPDPDRTVQLVRRRRRPAPATVAVVGGIVLVCGAAAFALTQLALHAGAPIRVASEAEILAHKPDGDLTLFRVDRDTDVLVFDFRSLAMQGRMLDRVAAFVEKAGLPRDRVLSAAQLAAAIAASGATEATYYYGHDYRAADLARFFAVADRQNVTLTRDEIALRGILRSQRLLAAGAVGAIISIPAEDPSQNVDRAMRAVILHHELSHGVYFTRPAFAAGAQMFWTRDLTDAEREDFRRFLRSEGYDTTQLDLLINETQAYLGFTPAARFFDPQRIGLTPAETASLRVLLRQSLPPGWPRAGD